MLDQHRVASVDGRSGCMLSTSLPWERSSPVSCGSHRPSPGGHLCFSHSPRTKNSARPPASGIRHMATPKGTSERRHHPKPSLRLGRDPYGYTTPALPGAPLWREIHMAAQPWPSQGLSHPYGSTTPSQGASSGGDMKYVTSPYKRLGYDPFCETKAQKKTNAARCWHPSWLFTCVVEVKHVCHFHAQLLPHLSFIFGNFKKTDAPCTPLACAHGCLSSWHCLLLPSRHQPYHTPSHRPCIRFWPVCIHLPPTAAIPQLPRCHPHCSHSSPQVLNRPLLVDASSTCASPTAQHGLLCHHRGWSRRCWGGSGC